MQEKKLTFIVDLINKAEGEFKKIQDNLSATAQATQNTNNVLSSVALTSGALFVGLGATILKTSNDFAAFNSAIQRAGINANASAEDIEELKTVSKEMSMQSVFSAEEIAKGLAFMVGGSVSAKDGIEALADTVQFAQANAISLETSALAANQAMVVFGKEGQALTHHLNVMTAGMRAGYATTDQFMDTIQQFGPQANLLGIEIADLSAIIASLGDQGFVGSEAATQLKRGFDSLTKGSDRTRDAIKELGLEYGDIASKIDDPIAMIGLLSDSFNNVESAVKRSQIATDIFGQGSAAWVSMLTNGNEELLALRDSLAESGDEMAKASGIMFQNMSFTQQMQKVFQNLSLTLGESFAPILSRVSAAITPILIGITKFIDNNKGLISTLIVVATSVAGITFAFSSMSLIVMKVRQGMVLLTAAKAMYTKVVTGAIFTTKSFKAALASTGIGLIVIAIGALITAFMKLSDELGGVGNAFKYIWATIKSGVADAALFIVNTLNKIPGFGKAFKLDDTIAMLEAMKSKATETQNAIVDNAAKTRDEYAKLQADMEKLAAGGGSGGDYSEPVDPEALEKITDALSNLGKEYESFAETADDSLYELEQSHKQSLASIASDIAKVRGQMSDLTADYAKTAAGDRMSIAGEIIKNEERIAQIQEELLQKQTVAKRQELEAELANRMLTAEENAGFIGTMEAEMAEVRRLNGLTELQRAIEEYEQKRLLAEQDYNAQMAMYKKEIDGLKQKQREEKELYNIKKNFITDIEAQMTINHQAMLNNKLKLTEETINKEIELYRKLAQAISSARSGDVGGFSRAVSKVTKVNDAVIKPNGQVISTHPDDWLIATKNPGSLGGGGGIYINFDGATFMGKEGVAREIGNEIMKELRLQTRFAP